MVWSTPGLSSPSRPDISQCPKIPVILNTVQTPSPVSYAQVEPVNSLRKQFGTYNPNCKSTLKKLRNPKRYIGGGALKEYSITDGWVRNGCLPIAQFRVCT